tara:strand:+ start:2063 stop:3877 length:1815 start_codon:yes stop_codon:yes gene_type:complete
MELAIPLVALGGLYVVSNQNNQIEKTKKNIKTKEKTPESFTNMGKKKNYIPNANIPAQNYPVQNNKELSDTVNLYANPNTSTDKYVNQTYYQNQQQKGAEVGNQIQQVYSMSGNYLDSKEFKHNNMVPFNGGKIRGNTYDMALSESILDNMVGSGNHVIKKIEQAPLFKPEDNISYTNGTPNSSDFYQSRVNPGMRNNNIKPFETQQVAPGLNQGYTTNGSGGFNSGMEARNSWLPKTVDQLRVATNPKMEYNLNNLEGPAEAVIKNPGLIGRVEKQLPDTFYINSQDRWLTTTGGEKGQALRPEQEMGIVRRPTGAVDYMGPAASTEVGVGRAPTGFEKSKRTPQSTTLFNDKTLRGTVDRDQGSDLNNQHKSYTNYQNSRTTTSQPDSFRSGFSGAIGAVVAPFLDALKPSRRDEVCANVRVVGGAGTTVENNYVNNPDDVAPTTIKETTTHSVDFNINNQSSQQYVNTYVPPEETNRQTTQFNSFGNVGNNTEGDMNYYAAYRQHNNDIKAQTINNRANQGGTQMFNQNMNLSIAKQDSNCMDNYTGPAGSIIQKPPSERTYGKMSGPQQLDMGIEVQRNQPDILDAFRSNPYTQSLTTSV